MALSGKQTKIGLTLLLAVPAVLTGTFWICPSLYVRAMQVTGMVRGTVNGFESKNRPMLLRLPDGIDLQTEIRYGTQYPNSWLDVYRNTGMPNLPTFISVKESVRGSPVKKGAQKQPRKKRDFSG